VPYPIPAPWELLSPQLNAAQTTSTPSVLERVPAEILACNFWLLSAPADSPHAQAAWFLPDGRSQPVVAALRQWNIKQQNPLAHTEWRKTQPSMKTLQFSESGIAPAPIGHPIAHYLLLPSIEAGITEWYLDAIRPFIKKYRPTVGFCIEEAAFAQRVTVVGGEHIFPEESLEKLLDAGCQVERIGGDGTSIATQLSAR
jgi:hypothetical protein